MARVDPKTIMALLGTADADTKREVEARITWGLTILESRLGHTLVRPTVEYNLKGSTAGWAIGKYKIRLNHELLLNPATHDEMINQTVPHELVHCVVDQLWPRAKSHGYEWQRLMLILGLTPDRCHDMPTTKARKHEREYKYRCSNYCTTYKFTKNRHTRAQKLAAERGAYYKCRNCGGRLTYSGSV